MSRFQHLTRRDDDLAQPEVAQAGVTDPAPERGVILAAYTPRWWPALKSVAAVTVFAFTLTTIVPSSFASQARRRSDTLRGISTDETTTVRSGLEEALGREGSANPSRRQVLKIVAGTATASLVYQLLGIAPPGDLGLLGAEPADLRLRTPAEVDAAFQAVVNRHPAIPTAAEGFLDARRIEGVPPARPVGISEERWNQAAAEYARLTREVLGEAEEFEGLTFDGLYAEYEPASDPNHPDRLLTRYARTWPYTNALVLLDLIAAGRRKEATELFRAVVRLGLQEQVLGFEGGYHFSYNADPTGVLAAARGETVEADGFWMDPRAPTGNNLWALSALYHYLIAFKDHSIYSAFAYWVEGDTLHYVTPQRVHNQASLSLLDRDLTEKLNRDRSMQVKLPR